MKLPQGFVGAATAAGIKSSGAKDLTLIVNHGPLNWASAVFTTNQVIAAPVMWSKEVIKGSAVRAVVLNSGGANACTGPQGFQDTHKTAEHVASLLNHSSSEIFVCSTGMIQRTCYKLSSAGWCMNNSKIGTVIYGKYQLRRNRVYSRQSII